MSHQSTMLRRRAAGFLAVPALVLGLGALPGIPAALAQETHVTISSAAYGATRKFEVEINKTTLVDLPLSRALPAATPTSSSSTIAARPSPCSMCR